MGNSESLSSYRYDFDDPKIGDLDLSCVKVYKIDDAVSAEEAKNFLRNERILYVDCEGHYFGNLQQRLGTVQVATGSDCCLVFHITKYRKSLDLLKYLFESNDVQKVFHDCSGDSSVLFHENQIQLKNTSVDDTQIAHKVIQSTIYKMPIDRTTGCSLADLYEIYCAKNIPGNKRFNKSTSAAFGGNMWIDNRELTSGMIKYAVVDVLAVCEVFAMQKKMLSRTPEYKELIKRQLERKIPKPEREERKIPKPEREEKKIPKPEREEKIPKPEREERKIPKPERKERKIPKPERKERKIPKPEREERKIPKPEREQIPQLQTSSGFSKWGLLASAGAVAVLALGAAAAAGGDESQRTKEDEEQQKKDECIIS